MASLANTIDRNLLLAARDAAVDLSWSYRTGLLHRSRWLSFVHFCQNLSTPIHPLAADEDALSLFAVWLSFRGRGGGGPQGSPLSAATIEKYISSIHCGFQSHGVPWPASSGRLSRTLAGIKRQLAPPSSSLPRFALSSTHLEKVWSSFWSGHANSAVPIFPLSCLAAATVAVYGMMRGSEFLRIPLSWPLDELERRTLRVGHLSDAPSLMARAFDSSFRLPTCRLHIPVCKTNQVKGRDVVLHPSSPSLSASVCPVGIMAVYLSLRYAAAPFGSDAPLFVGHDCEAPLERSEYLGWLRPLLAVQGVDPSSVTTHCHRRGGAQSLQSSGASLGDIMKAGGWKSRAVLAYLRPQTALAPDLSSSLSSSSSSAPPPAPSPSPSPAVDPPQKKRQRRTRSARHGVPMDDVEVALAISKGRFDLH